jgi:Protein of unknown function (DUF3570)
LVIGPLAHSEAQNESPGRGTATSTLYARTDSNATTVWSPRTQVVAQAAEDLTVEASYAMDAWTSASIDIVTAATRAVHEVRHEVNAGAVYSLGARTLRASYRYSLEPDYWSHGLVLGTSFDFAQRNTTLDLVAIGALDTVGRAGDARFRQDQRSFGARVALTQVLDRSTLVQLAWDVTQVRGFQASPYRYVAVGGAGTCASLALLCLPEHVPDQRTRQALIARARRALGSHFSLGFSYRFYVDSWDVRSQTLAPELSWLPFEGATFSLSYRYYTQGQADFYRPRYLDASPPAYLTRDRELSAFYSHQVGLSYAHEVPFERRRLALSLAVRAAGTYFHYLAFVGLREVRALELTGLLALRLD